MEQHKTTVNPRGNIDNNKQFGRKGGRIAGGARGAISLVRSITDLSEGRVERICCGVWGTLCNAAAIQDTFSSLHRGCSLQRSSWEAFGP